MDSKGDDREADERRLSFLKFCKIFTGVPKIFLSQFLINKFYLCNILNENLSIIVRRYYLDT